MRTKFAVGAWIVLAGPVWASGRHSAQGILLEVNPAKNAIVVSCEAIPGYMDAMVMPFKVRGPLDVKKLVPGSALRFNIVESRHQEVAEGLQVVPLANHESEPTEAGRLTLLNRALDPTLAQKIVPVGGPVPDFTLTDQAHRPARLSQFRGKVVAITFAYSRCPNPNYCFRLSNNLSVVERRFRARAGTDLILMTIVIDPAQDRDKALERYADTWKADPAAWRFVTGPVDSIRAIAASFGMDFWKDEGFLIHNFHTVIIDRDGNLAANLEGNQFTAGQLGDLVEVVMQRPSHHGTLAAATTQK